jgi:hypothetical protein
MPAESPTQRLACQESPVRTSAEPPFVPSQSWIICNVTNLAFAHEGEAIRVPDVRTTLYPGRPYAPA